jgi:hypothetical protein
MTWGAVNEWTTQAGYPGWRRGRSTRADRAPPADHAPGGPAHRLLRQPGQRQARRQPQGAVGDPDRCGASGGPSARTSCPRPRCSSWSATCSAAPRRGGHRPHRPSRTGCPVWVGSLLHGGGAALRGLRRATRYEGELALSAARRPRPPRGPPATIRRRRRWRRRPVRRRRGPRRRRRRRGGRLGEAVHERRVALDQRPPRVGRHASKPVTVHALSAATWADSGARPSGRSRRARRPDRTRPRRRGAAWPPPATAASSTRARQARSTGGDGVRRGDSDCSLTVPDLLRRSREDARSRRRPPITCSRS